MSVSSHEATSTPADAESEMASERSAENRGSRLVWPAWGDRLLAVLVPGFVLALHTRYYGAWIEDDAAITFAYARSIATGAGPVLQPGAAPVEAYSNPAWLAIMVVGRWLGLFDHGSWFDVPDLVAFPKLVAFTCCLGIFSSFYSVARRVSSRPVLVTAIAGSLASAVPSFVIWTMSGLENSLFALAVVGLAGVMTRSAVSDRLLVRRTALLCGALAALAALTRPDGAIYVLAYPVAVAMTAFRLDRTILRAVGASVACFAVPIAIVTVLRLVSFGDWLPNTARAKEQGLPTVDDLGGPNSLIAYAGWLTVIVAVVVVTVALRRHSATRTALRMLLIPLGLAVLSYAILKPDWMAQFRFATPLWALAALIIVLAVEAVVVGAGRRLLVGTAAVSVVALVLTGIGWSNAAANFKRIPTAPLCGIAIDTGYTMNSYADILGLRGGTLLAVDGGGTALTSQLRFVDLAGLADRRIGEFWQRDDMAGLRNYVFDDVRPTFFRIWASWGGDARTHLLSDPRLARDYELIFAPGIGSGTWVRRDAVAEPARLVEVRRWAVILDDRLRAQRLNRASPTDWLCPDALRPDPLPSAFVDPASTP